MINKNVTLTQAQFNALMERISVLETAVNSSNLQTEAKSIKKSTTSSTTKTAKKSTTSSTKKSSPKKSSTSEISTREQALTLAYGNAQARKKFVANSNKEAIAFLKKSKVAYTLTENGKVAFKPYKEQKPGLFASKKEFAQFREDFRSEFKYA